MNQEYIGPEDRNDNSWKDVLVRDRWKLIGLGIAVAGAWAYFGYDVTIPRWARLFVLSSGLAALVAYAPASRIVAWLFSPDFTYLVDLDARDNELAIWQLPPKAWRELEVSEGELYRVRATVPAWECKGYDPEENSALGTWRGSASDLELIEDRERIDEIRGILEDLAKEGLTIRVKQSGIIRDSVRGIVMSFIEGFESESLYDGDEIEKSVEKALTRWTDDDDENEPDEIAPGDDGSLSEENTENGAAVAPGGTADD